MTTPSIASFGFISSSAARNPCRSCWPVHPSRHHGNWKCLPQLLGRADPVATTGHQQPKGFLEPTRPVQIPYRRPAHLHRDSVGALHPIDFGVYPVLERERGFIQGVGDFIGDHKSLGREDRPLIGHTSTGYDRLGITYVVDPPSDHGRFQDAFRVEAPHPAVGINWSEGKSWGQGGDGSLAGRHRRCVTPLGVKGGTFSRLPTEPPQEPQRLVVLVCHCLLGGDGGRGEVPVPWHSGCRSRPRMAA